MSMIINCLADDIAILNDEFSRNKQDKQDKGIHTRYVQICSTNAYLANIGKIKDFDASQRKIPEIIASEFGMKPDDVREAIARQEKKIIKEVLR